MFRFVFPFTTGLYFGTHIFFYNKDRINFNEEVKLYSKMTIHEMQAELKTYANNNNVRPEIKGEILECLNSYSQKEIQKKYIKYSQHLKNYSKN